MKLSEQAIIEIMVYGLSREGARSIDDGSDDAKQALTQLYLAKYDWDIDITFNMRELRDAKTDKEKTDLLNNELYAQAEEEFGAAINERLAQMGPRGRMYA